MSYLAGVQSFKVSFLYLMASRLASSQNGSRAKAVKAEQQPTQVRTYCNAAVVLD